MKRTIEEPTINEHGDEVHPAFGMAGVNRVSSNPGAVLFDSELQHTQYVVLRVSRASRKRDLNRDWIHEEGRGGLIEIAMSEAQWASLVSSVNTSGVPVTITRTESEVAVPELPFSPRLAVSHDEVRGAADRMYAEVVEARDAYEAHKTAANLRALHYAIENAASNVEFSAKSLTEHAENVVQKARADVEAMVTSHAQQLGIAAADMPTLALTTAAAGTENDEEHADV